MTDDESRERLLMVATMLENLDAWRAELVRNSHVPRLPTRFDMSVWVETTEDCGTSACAIGHAMMHPWFIERGLTTRLGAPCYDSSYAFTAVTRFFGISLHTAKYLFGVDHNNRAADTPETVALRIRTYVATDWLRNRREADYYDL